LVQYMLGRLSSDTFVKMTLVQILAAFSMVLVYKMPKIQVE
jgi:hypothetical protein